MENTAFLTNIKIFFKKKLQGIFFFLMLKINLATERRIVFMKKKKARKEKRDKQSVNTPGNQKDAFDPDDYYEY